MAADNPEPIPFVHDGAVAYGVEERISPLIRRVVANNPGPFTYTGTGVYIVGAGPLAVIDPGPDDDAHIAALLSAIGGADVSHIFVTHNHRDHSPAAAPLSEATGAPVFAFADAAGQAPSEEPNIVEEGTDRGFQPDVAIAHGDRFSGPGWTIEAVHTPGHTANHVCFALSEEKALFTASMVQPGPENRSPWAMATSG
ncbi:MAG: MBL fold metallo-hydrolase [Pseudomonadota bacterium]